MNAISRLFAYMCCLDEDFGRYVQNQGMWFLEMPEFDSYDMIDFLSYIRLYYRYNSDFEG